MRNILSYVFRPHHVILIIISIVGMIKGKSDGFFLLFFIGIIIKIGARFFSYFVDQRIHEGKKAYLDSLEQEKMRERKGDS